MGRKILEALVAIGVVFSFAYLAVGYVLYDTLSDIEGGCAQHAANRPDTFTDLGGFWPEDFDFAAYAMPDYETVRFPSRAAEIEIAGWYVAAAPDAPAVILVHGLGACKNVHSVLTPAGMLHQAGFNVLLIDVRDAGESTREDGRSAIGNEEYLDVLGAWDWLIAEKGIPPAQIGFFGNSMGAATTLIAFSQEPRVAALFVDSPFDNLPQIIREELDRAGYPQFLLPGGLAAARLFAGDNLLAFDPGEAIEQANGRPIFVVHGTADSRISVEHSRRLQARAEAAGANATFWFAEGVEHVRAAAAETAVYEQRLIAFFRQALEDA